jgi:enoyl-CoA hydratase/carnithine racemase
VAQYHHLEMISRLSVYLARLAADPVVLAEGCHKSPLALKMGKNVLTATAKMPLEKGLDNLCRVLPAAVKTHDAREGMRIFLKKCKPKLTWA